MLESTPDGTLISRRYSPYTSSIVSNVLMTTRLRQGTHDVAGIAAIFPDLPMAGHRLVLGALPFDAYLAADEDPSPQDKFHIFVNHTGFEILMLEEAAKKFVSCVNVCVELETRFSSSLSRASHMSWSTLRTLYGAQS